MAYYSYYKKFYLLVGTGASVRRTTISVESYFADSLAIKLSTLRLQFLQYTNDQMSRKSFGNPIMTQEIQLPNRGI
jgi:hypothetical protein